MSASYTHRLRTDQNGRITEKTEIVADVPVTWTYAYDKAGRLTEAHLDNRLICQCWYDKEGRRTQDYFPATHDSSIRHYEYRLDNRLARAGNCGYVHDDNGFRSLWSNGSKYTIYEYAPDYRLLKAEWPEKADFSFRHDKNGQRVAKYRDGKLVEAYRWLDFVRLAGFFSHKHAYEFAYHDGERTPFAMRRDDGTVFGLFYDQTGSLRVVADIDDNVIKEVLYDPFGGIIEDTNPDFRLPIGFAGGLHDHDLGFVRFGWRDYDTHTSRWTAPDPMGDAGGDDDWYGYCLDDPVNSVDPLGLFQIIGDGPGGRIVEDMIVGAVGGARTGAALGPGGAAAGAALGGAVGGLWGVYDEGELPNGSSGDDPGGHSDSTDDEYGRGKSWYGR